MTKRKAEFATLQILPLPKRTERRHQCSSQRLLNNRKVTKIDKRGKGKPTNHSQPTLPSDNISSSHSDDHDFTGYLHTRTTIILRKSKTSLGILTINLQRTSRSSLRTNMSVSTALILAIAFQVNTPVQAQPAFSDNGGYFYHEEGFHIVSRALDLTEISPALTLLHKHNLEMRDAKTSSANIQDLKMSVTKEINNRIGNANYTLNNMITPTTRGRRGIDEIGDLWNVISSAPGPKQYWQQNKAINTIKKDLKQQTLLTMEGQKQIDNIMKMEAAETTVINKATEAINIIHKHEIKTNTEVAQMATILTFRSNALECLDEVDHTLVKAREIMTEGKNNRLSSQLISKEDLSDVVLSLTINTKKSGLQPIFDTKYLHRYYQLKLTHVYMSRNRIISYTRIPLTDLTDAYIIDNIVSDNNILLRSQHQHYFRLISASELNRCLQHDNIFFSYLRPIQLPSTQLSCEKVQCKSRLTETVIDELKPNHFLYKLPANGRIRATIIWENSKTPTPFLLEPRGTLII